MPERRGIAGVSHDGERLAGRHALARAHEGQGDVAVVDVLPRERAARGFDHGIVGPEARGIAGDGADDPRRDRVHQRSVGRDLDVDPVVGAPEPGHVLRVEGERVALLGAGRG